MEGYLRSATTLTRALAAPGDNLYFAVRDSRLIGRLKELDVVGNKAYIIRLVTPAALADACRSLSLDPSLASSIADLAHCPCPLMGLLRPRAPPRAAALPPGAAAPADPGPSTSTAGAADPSAPAPLPARVAVGQWVTAGSRLVPGKFGTWFYATHLRMPVKLSDIKWQPSDLKARYGLAQKAFDKMASFPVRHEMVEFVRWCRDPVRTDRALAKALKHSTMETAQDVIYKLLGFALKFKGAPNSAISLRLFSHQVIVMEYISFVYARSSTWTTMSKEISQIKRVVIFLVAADGAECREVTSPPACITATRPPLRPSLSLSRHPPCRSRAHPPTHARTHADRALCRAPDVLVEARASHQHGDVAGDHQQAVLQPHHAC